MIKYLKISVSFLLIILLQSCKSINLYSSDYVEKDISDLVLDSDNFLPRIHVDDKISISIWDHEEMSVGSVFGIYSSNEVFGKWLLVHPDSTILLPKIGAVKLAGLTLDEARLYLTKRYAEYIVNPLIDVRVHSHEVSILGQVIRPGNYPIYKGSNSLPYLIAAAGGTDFYSKLDEVKLARGDKSYLLDLTKMDPITMNRITLMPGDVLYFPTKSGKVLEKKSPVLLAFASITTTVLLIFSASR